MLTLFVFKLYDLLIPRPVKGVYVSCVLLLCCFPESCGCLAGREGFDSSLAGATQVVVLGRTITTVRAVDAEIVLAHVAVPGAASAGDSSSIAKVVVDSNKVRGHAASADILNDNMARAVCLVVRAVATAAVELSRVGNSVIADRNATTAIVLDDLVISTSGTALLNENFARSKSSDSVCLG